MGKKIDTFVYIIGCLLLLISYTNCSDHDGGSKGSNSSAYSLNNQLVDEKAIYVLNSITYQDYDIILFSHRDYFSSAQLLNWNLYFSGTGSCETLETPESPVKDSIRLSCSSPGILKAVLVAYLPPIDPDQPYHIEKYEHLIYIKNADEIADELALDNTNGTTIVETRIFPNGREIPNTNTSGGGGEDPNGSGADQDSNEALLRGGLLYSNNCRSCHGNLSTVATPILAAEANGNGRAYLMDISGRLPNQGFGVSVGAMENSSKVQNFLDTATDQDWEDLFIYLGK